MSLFNYGGRRTGKSTHHKWVRAYQLFIHQPYSLSTLLQLSSIKFIVNIAESNNCSILCAWDILCGKTKEHCDE